MSNLSKRYKDYPEAVQEYMTALVGDLESDYGRIPSAWIIPLDMIADNLVLYKDSMDKLLSEGSSYTNRDNRIVKHPAVTIMNNAMSVLQPLLKAFACSPVQRQKLKLLEAADAESVVDNYVNSLTD